ncbi:glycosyltransferase family 4 protein [Candidatus Poribacteria bacterium]|nr:glycosyltransferase family 4 protein [Candidatus Poribacteria bacterium]
MAEVLRILYVHPLSQLGGSDISLFQLVREMINRNHKCVVVFPFDGFNVPKFKHIGVQVRFIPEIQGFNRTYNLLRLSLKTAKIVPAIKKLLDIIKQENIDIVHSNTTTTWPGGIAARIAKVPTVHHVREVTIASPKILGWAITHIVNSMADKIITVSNAAGKVFHDNRILKNNLVTIYNGVDIQEFHPSNEGTALRKEFGIDDNTVLVGLVGRFNPRRGHRCFIEACAKVKNGSSVDTKFMIVGGKPKVRGKTQTAEEKYESEMLSLIKKLGLEREIILTGTRQDIPQVMAALDILAHPSTTDAGPRSPLEAMASGKPVIASAVEGNIEEVEDGVTGILFPSSDSDALSQALIKLIENKIARERLGSAGRKRVERLFTTIINADRTESLYFDLLRTYRR